MLVGIFIKHYKIYKNINYIPISNGELFSSYIGENGIGKTSILCALDKFFNYDDSREWNINNSAINDGLGEANKPFIVPLFLIKKSEFVDNTHNKRFTQLAEKLSEYFWETKYTSSTKEISKFYTHRTNLKKKYQKKDYYLLLVGKKYNENKNTFFDPFHSDDNLKRIILAEDINKNETNVATNEGASISGSEENNKEIKIEHEIKEVKIQKEIKDFRENIIKMYTYLFLPVEIEISDYTKLEKKSMQSLMGMDIENTIKKAIKNIDINEVNKNLKKFLEEIENDLEEFKYKGVGKRQNITEHDLVEKIIEAYFSIKVLHKKVNANEIDIKYLSSGEKRKALLEIAYAFLKKESQRDRKIILGIDEPEASLHVSNCFSQFEKIKKIANLNTQVITTTHWYGFLPIFTDGIAINITNKDSKFSFDVLNLLNYREQITNETKNNKGNVPYDISLKSYNDLVQSIISSMQEKNKYNWLICEGLSEKIYFEYYFKNEIFEKNLRVLSVGGYKYVKKIHEYLRIPMNEKELELKGKVYCLIDTDRELLQYDLESNKNLEFKRLLRRNDNSVVDLVKVNDSKISPETEIEDCLEPKVFYKTLEYFTTLDEELKEIMDINPQNNGAKISRAVLNLREGDVINLKKFFNKDKGENKIKFAQKYIEILDGEEKKETPEWIEEIRNYFNYN